MPFTRKFEASYPCVYNTWKAEDGVTVTVQDLAPEDDEAAVEIMKENFLRDEMMSNYQKIIEDPISVQDLVEFWRKSLKQRMTIGCYEEKDGKKTLVALNCCTVGYKGEEKNDIGLKQRKCQNVFNVIKFAENRSNSYEYTGESVLLHGMGLCVRRESRGRKLGQKILAAREPLCRSQGINATVTLFSGLGSQISADRVGFETMTEFTLGDLAKNGFDYLEDDKRVIKYMALKYV